MPHVTSTNPHILAYKRTGKKYSYIFVFNYHGMDMDTVIGTQLNNREISIDLHLRSSSYQILKFMEGKCLDVKPQGAGKSNPLG